MPAGNATIAIPNKEDSMYGPILFNNLSFALKDEIALSYDVVSYNL